MEYGEDDIGGIGKDVIIGIAEDDIDELERKMTQKEYGENIIYGIWGR